MAGKTFPKFSAHAQPTILRIRQEVNGAQEYVYAILLTLWRTRASAVMILTYFVGNIQVAVPGWLCFFYLQRERNGVFVYRLLRPWWHDDRHFGFEVMVCILPGFISAFGNNPWRNIVLNNNEVHCNASNSDWTNKGCHKMMDGEFHPLRYWGPPRDSTVGSWVRVSVLQFRPCQLQAIQMKWNIKLVAIFKILQHIMIQLAYIAPV